MKVTNKIQYNKRKDGGTIIHLKGNQKTILDIQGAVASRKGYKTEETLDEAKFEIVYVKKLKIVYLLFIILSNSSKISV